MYLALEIAAAWIAADIALVAAWHAAHVRSRRFGAPVTSARATQQVYTLASEPSLRDARPALVGARPS